MNSKKYEYNPHHERRASKRVKKNFILTYFEVNNPSKKHEITQLRNISMGGMCFVSSVNIAPGTELSIDLKTPYLSNATYLKGTVLESHEKINNLIFETRLQFKDLTVDAKFLLNKLIEFFLDEENGKDE